MKSFLVLAGALLFSNAAHGDAGTIIRERAKGVSQTPPPPGSRPTAVAPSAPAPQPNPAMAATQQNISNLANDLLALQTDAKRKQPLINDLNAAAAGIKPAKATISGLADDLALALAGKNLSAEQCAKFARCLRGVSNRAHLSPAQERGVFEDATKILTAAGVSPEQTAKIITGLKTIAAETK
jgi:hypothetical protein